MSNTTIIQGSDNIFEDLGFSPEESQHLIIRADLMLQIRRIIQNQNWTVEQAAIEFGVSPDRIQSLLKGKIGEFTIEQLISLLSRTGMKVKLEVLPNVA
jgi:predicted XRE-type DNA-binding protein